MLPDMEPSLASASDTAVQLYFPFRMNDVDILNPENIARTHARADVVWVVKVIKNEGQRIQPPAGHLAHPGNSSRE